MYDEMGPIWVRLNLVGCFQAESQIWKRWMRRMQRKEGGTQKWWASSCQVRSPKP